MTTAPIDDPLFYHVFERTSDALCLVNGDGRCLAANEPAADLFGDKREQLAETPIDGAIESKFVASTELRPGVHLVLLRERDRDDNRDSHRQRTERLGRIFKATPGGIVVIDGDEAIVEMNRRARSIFGIGSDVEPDLDSNSEERSSAEGGEGREKSREFYKDYRWRFLDDEGAELPRGDHPVTEVLETGRVVSDGEYGIERADGSILWVCVDAVPIFDAHGAVDRVVIGITDITDRQEYRRLLEQQNDRLEEYSATVSHDLRTPLSIASGWLDVAIEEESTETLGKVESALDRMGTLISDLRVLGRHGQTVESMTELDLPELVAMVWSNVETNNAALELEEDLDTIDGERDRLKALLENLIRNAIEHAGPNVTVRVGPIEDGFYVADDGPGIPVDKRDTVFEFGYSTTERGTGIGLAIVEAVADAHGWRVELLDAERGGTRFEFRTRWHPDREGRSASPDRSAF